MPVARHRWPGWLCTVVGIGALVLVISLPLSAEDSGVPSHAHPSSAVSTAVSSQSCGVYLRFTNQAGLTVNASQCEPEVSINYSNGSLVSVVGYSVSWLSEVRTNGSVVALANESAPFHESRTWSVDPNGTTFEISYTTNVTSGSGAWSPNATREGPGSQKMRQGSQVMGSATLALTFFLMHGGSNDFSVRFSLNISDWPWVSPSDELGVEVDSTAAPTSSLAWSAASSTLNETSATGTVAALLFAGSATSPSNASTRLGVVAQAGVFSVGGGSDDDTAVLLTFTGGPGGYASLSYDPWVNFYPSPASVPVSPPLSMTTWLAIIAVVAIAVVMGAFGLYVRRKPIEEGLSPVADRGRRTRAWT